MENVMVTFDKVSLAYQELAAETLAIQDLSFTVCEGEFVAVVGPSGCGKTSMLSLLSGLMEPSAGVVRLHGGRDTIGYMLQRDHLFDWRTVESNVLLGLEVKHLLTEETRAHAMALLKTYGLWDFRRHYPSQLSGGMRQKVALIRTLAFDPSLLLLDEPFSALDYQTRLRVADEVYSIIRREHKTAILVTHDIAEAVSLADRVIVFTGRPARVGNIHPIKLSAEDVPFARRNAPEFKDYFNRIWGELESYGT